MKFQVGEIAILQDLGGEHEPYNGREVEVTAYLGVLSSEGNDPWYEVRAPWIREISPTAYAIDLAEEHLRKRPQPPDWSEIAHRNSRPVRKLEPA